MKQIFAWLALVSWEKFVLLPFLLIAQFVDMETGILYIYMSTFFLLFFVTFLAQLAACICVVGAAEIGEQTNELDEGYYLFHAGRGASMAKSS